MNPYHKSTGHYPPRVVPIPVHKLSVGERFSLMFKGNADAPKKPKKATK